MPKTYSHSKLETFEQCKQKYKFRYIDKIEIKEKPIEAFLGSVVRETLEWLYQQVKQKKLPSIDETIIYYIASWEKSYTPEVYIVRHGLKTADYFNMGITFILNYYTKHHPFDDNTLETEKRICIKLDEPGKNKLTGIIDRLVHNTEKNEIEIHDYKTANILPTKEKIDNDRQLALYSIAIKEEFGSNKKVKLIWHYLAFNEKLVSERTDEQLEQLKKETLKLIGQIESETEFAASKSILCDWCQFKKMCPAWGQTPT